MWAWPLTHCHHRTIVDYAIAVLKSQSKCGIPTRPTERALEAVQAPLLRSLLVAKRLQQSAGGVHECTLLHAAALKPCACEQLLPCLQRCSPVCNQLDYLITGCLVR